MKSYSIDYVVGANTIPSEWVGETHITSGKCCESTKETIERLRKWAKKYGHTLVESTYKESKFDDNPAFVRACLADIAGFKR